MTNKQELQINSNNIAFPSANNLSNPEQQNNEVDNSQAQIGVPEHEQKHITTGQYLKSLVYGGLDGTVNTLSVIIGGIASGATPANILAIGVSVMIGDGLGMGLGDYLSAKSQKQFVLSEQKRQFWEIQNKLADQKRQVVQIYEQKQYTKAQAERLADLFETNHRAFVNIMMLEQLGLVVDDSNPLVNGIITFFAFALLGFLPLIPFCVERTTGVQNSTKLMGISFGIAGFMLLLLGYAKSALISMPMSHRILSAVEMVLMAAIATAAGFGIGKIFQN